ncbi:MAG: ABC transporter substrate-binding protein, partial [Candidatus Doudnabacteria bacterium]|nr:ABC transporter substrate-binding protein [Candidatus Doudnabacteria bacterium]
MSLENRLGSMSLLGKLVFSLLLILFVGSAIGMLWKINNSFLVDVPRTGGSFTEGVIGLPRYINPVLAVTDGDKDIAALVYSGLMKYGSDGSLVPDLAESYTISPDGKMYTFTLQQNATFQDGSPVTSDDIEFTVKTIQNPAIKSVVFANWAGVAIQKPDARHIIFILSQPYAPFIENTTIGILPKHAWEATNESNFSLSELNIDPVGSGPYKVSSIKKTSNGIPTDYVLTPFKKHIPDQAKISEITISFYANESALVEAYTHHEIDSMNGISPETASRFADAGVPISESALPRVFGVFFNQTGNLALADKTVRQALDLSVNRAYIVNTVLQGYGRPLSGPVPDSFVNLPQATTSVWYDQSMTAALSP